jgi:hypothetical protein
MQYTVVAVYAETMQRYAESVEAEGPAEAERIVRENAPDDIIVAGVIEGVHDCVDLDTNTSL